MKTSTIRTALLTAILLFFSSGALAGDFDGTWLLFDSGKQPFEAVLAADGTASGTHGDAMKQGTWQEQDGAAVIHWDTGWTTRIYRHGDHFMKEAFRPGDDLTDRPANTSSAERKD